MKKLLVVLLAVAMLFAFAACAQEPAEPDTSATDVEEEVLVDPQLPISENLPTFNMQGNYTATENTLEGAVEGDILWTYAGDADSEYVYATAYSWDASELTLEEEAQADIDKYFPDQNLSVGFSDYWHEPGEAEHSYYCGYIAESNLFVQSWFFRDGDKIYQVVGCIEGIKYTVDELNVEVYVPKCMEKLDTPVEGAVMCFRDTKGEFPAYNIYTHSDEYEFTAEAIAEAWGVENVQVEEHNYSDSITEEELGGYYVTCDFEVDGVKIVGHNNIIGANGEYGIYEFTISENDFDQDYLEAAETALLYAANPIE